VEERMKTRTPAWAPVRIRDVSARVNQYSNAWPPNQSGSVCQPKTAKTGKIKKNNGPIEFHALGHVSVVSATISDFPLVLTNLAIL